MGRRVDVDLLVGAGEIVRRLGLKRVQELHYYRRSDPTFPPAVFRVAEARGGAHVWYWPDIERWARRKGRLPAASPAEKKTLTPKDE
ncbi:MAG: hypothetical protein ACRDZW_07380 [Acidimicrobiales bacterium]